MRSTVFLFFLGIYYISEIVKGVLSHYTYKNFNSHKRKDVLIMMGTIMIIDRISVNKFMRNHGITRNDPEFGEITIRRIGQSEVPEDMIMNPNIFLPISEDTLKTIIKEEIDKCEHVVKFDELDDLLEGDEEI